MAYLTLFINAFISATIFPLASEALLIYDIKAGYDTYLLLTVATLGNSLGAIFNYFLGLKGEEFLIQKRVLKAKSITKYKTYFDKFGFIPILFSWLPIIGDGFTFVAGILRYNVKIFIILVFIAKFSRYLFLVSIV